MASNAIAGVGTRFQRWNGTIWQDIAEISSIGGYGMDTDVLEVTTLDTEGTFREFVPGFSQGTVVSLSMNFTRLTYILMRNDFISKMVLRYRILLPDDDEGDSSGALSMLAFNGFVKHVELGFVTDDKITSAVEIQMTGAVEGAIQDDDEEEEEDTFYIYVSTTGNDNNDGMSSATAWRTIDKVNQEWSNGTIQPGDKIFFRRGDTFEGTLAVGSSGEMDNHIYLGAYGSGTKPRIIGYETPTAWSSAGGGVYYTTLSPESDPNLVTLNGNMQPMGRFPKSGYLIVDSRTSSSITDSDLDASVTNWEGAELVIRKNRWITDRCPITDHTGSTLTFTTVTPYNTAPGYGYFIQNDLRCVTQLGDWYWDSATGRLYMHFGGGVPGSYTVRVAVRDMGIEATTFDYLTIENIHTEGFNRVGININRVASDVCNFITIERCEISYIGGHGIYGQYPQRIRIHECNIDNTAINGITLSPATSAATNFYDITDNVIDKVYVYMGMGTRINEEQGIGIFAKAIGTRITGNTLTNVGYIPINAGGENLLVENNHADRYGWVMDDCGGVYIFNDLSPNKRVRGNIVRNAIGAGLGTPDGEGSSSAHAYYSDGGTQNVEWTDNIGGNISGSAWHANVPVNQVFSDNTFFECSGFLDFWKFGDAGFFDARGIFINGLNIQGNTFITSRLNLNMPELIRYQNSSNETYNGNLNDEIAHFGIINNNRYIINTECAVHIIYYPNDLEAAPMTIAKWAELYGHDVDSYVEVMDTYVINSLGANLLSNSEFNSGISGWTAATGSIAWRNVNELGHGGSVRYTGAQSPYTWYWWSNDNQISASVAGGVIDSAKHYLLRLRGKSSINKTWSFKLRSTGTGFPVQRHFALETTPQDKEVLLSNPIAVASGATIRLKDGDGVADTDLDNIYLYEANVTPINFDDYLHLIVNETNQPRVFIFSSPMIDSFGNTHNSVTLMPYTGMVLRGYGTISEQ